MSRKTKKNLNLAGEVEKSIFDSFRPPIAVIFWSSKRFKFEKTEENDFLFDGHQNGRWQRLKISNLNLICVCVERKTKTY